MKPTDEEKAAYETGFSSMWETLRGGEIPPHDFIATELQTLFTLASKSERTQIMQRGANLEIDKTVSTERSCAQVPACRFHGSMAALLEYSKACRASGYMPGDVKFD